ncbi:MAG: hypothetical protein MJ102_07540 [Clostridia bacterium]|nr:hypothetical protein [Clostridia bacterium]
MKYVWRYSDGVWHEFKSVVSSGSEIGEDEEKVDELPARPEEGKKRNT